MHWLRHPIFTRFSLLCLVGTLVLGAGMGYAISALLTRAASDWEWQNTAGLVRRDEAAARAIRAACSHLTMSNSPSPRAAGGPQRAAMRIFTVSAICSQ